MMQKLGLISSVCAALALVLLVAPEGAEARRHGNGGFGGAPASRTFGIGLILGTPTGLSLELRLSPRTALDFAIGFDELDDDDDDFGDDDGGYFHFDYLVYLADLSRGGSVGVPLYLGIGAAIYDDDDGFDDDDLNVGLRVPFGIALALRSVPLQFFFELAVRILVVDDDDGRDDDNVDLTGGLGFRIYF